VKQFLALLMLPLLTGCAAAGALAYKFGPPDMTPAKYQLGQDPTVVLVEDAHNPAAAEIDSMQIAALLRADLTEHKSAVLVDEGAVLKLRDADPAAFAKMTIGEIGRAVKAKQIVYVDVQRVSIELDTGGQMVKGTIETMCRVVDAQTGINRWPVDSPSGTPVGFETPFTAINERMTESDVRRKLHEKVVLSIGRFFRQWSADLEGQ
jgi:hypothetical protein